MTPGGSAYRPLEPARRPGGKPEAAPAYRVLVHRKFAGKWSQVVSRVGLDAAQALWDHLATAPGSPPPTSATCYLRGKAGLPQGPGWSRTVHYELSSMARVNYQFHDAFRASDSGDEHRVVGILSIDYSSH